jgi:hypothetical protein
MWKYLKRSNIQRLTLVILIYMTLAVAYSLVTPIGRGADEWAHFWYAQFIAQNGRLPTSPAEREAAGYKSDWPPLYHLSTAALTGWIDTAGPPTFKYRAYNIRRQIVPAQGSDAILHTEDELFPWRQEILVWHLGRFLSIAFAAAALVVTYFIALEVFLSSKGVGEQVGRGAGSKVASSRVADFSPLTIHHSSFIIHYSPLLALISTAILAFNPRFLFTGMVFGYDSLTLLLASLFLWLAMRVAKGYHRRWGFWGLGALAGLALMTKYLAVLLPLELVLLVFGAAKKRRGEESRETGRQEEVELSLIASDKNGLEKEFAPSLPHSPTPLRRLGQAALAYLLVITPWFAYLLVNFNEIHTYGPVLGTLAPLLRGDSSDRTMDELFAWFSGGQTPPPAHIEKNVYTAWQIIAELPTTFWGNPITRPYPLNWFIIVMTLVTLSAIVGLVITNYKLRIKNRRLPPVTATGDRPFIIHHSSFIINLLLLHSALAIPFMLIRLFGARDALEAVQGRHLLFLSGPALAILLVLGLARFAIYDLRPVPRPGVFTNYLICPKSCLFRFTFTALLGLLLTGSLSQLIYMAQLYPLPLPVRTTAYQTQPKNVPRFTLPGGATLIDYALTPPLPYSLLPTPYSLKISLTWQGGESPAPADYRTELALVDSVGQTQAAWLGYQTQARYPTRVWEPGDVIRDDGWLPLGRLEVGDYELKLRLWDEDGPVTDWQTLSNFTLGETMKRRSDEAAEWLLWRDGQPAASPPLFRERETAQFTLSNLQSPISNFQSPRPSDGQSNLYLIGPDNLPRPPASAGPGWANFIVGPAWPPGDYRLSEDGPVALRVAANNRNFQPPPIAHPLEVNFDNHIKLLGYDLPTRRVNPGEGLPITLYWQGLPWMGEDFVIFNRLLDNSQVAYGGYDRRARENDSTLFWAPGEVITDSFAVPIAVDAPPGVYTLNLGWYRRVNGQAESLPLLDPQSGQPTGQTALTLGPFKVGGPPPEVTLTQAAPQTEVNAILGEEIKLLGFDIANERTANGEISSPRLLASSPLRLTLYWQALRPPSADYTVFVHLRNAVGETVAQKDGPPAGGIYPTGLWDSGEIIKDEIIIPLEQLAPGQYELVVGLYDLATGSRLPVPGSPDNVIRLRVFEVGQ